MLTTRFNFTKYLRLIAILLIIAGFLGLTYGRSFAVTGINRQINFQGKLVNTDGTNVANGNYTVIFSIYDHPTTGSPTSGYLWKETQTVSVTDGIFRVMLGSSTAFPANFNFNWSGLYLGMKVNSDNEMTPRIEMTAVPYAFNAEKVAGLTIQDESGNASTSGTLKIPNAKTVAFAGATSFGAGTTGLVTLGSNTDTLAFTTAGATAITLPTSGTILTNTAAAIQTITSTQSTGTILGITDATALAGAIKGAVITLSGANAQDQTGLEFNLSNATGTNLNDIVGTGGLWKVSKTGVLTVASCTGCGGAGSVNFWDITNGLLSNGNTTLDFGIGGNSTQSAKFAVLNLGNGETPIASIAGLLVLGSPVGTTRTIGSTAMNPLQLGDANTGNLQFYSNSNRLTSAGDLTLAGKFNGLTITNNGTNTLNVGAGLTLAVLTASKTLTGAGTQISIANNLDFGAGTTGLINLGTGTNTLALATTNNTSVTLPTGGTLLTNTASANQTLTSTQTSGNIFSISDSTGLTSAITALTIGLTASTNSQNKTGISFDLSGGTSGTYYDLLGTGSTWSMTRAGALTVASCSGCGGVGSVNYWDITN